MVIYCTHQRTHKKQMGYISKHLVLHIATKHSNIALKP